MVASQPNHSAAMTAEASVLSTSEKVGFLSEQVEFLSAQVDSLRQMVEKLNLELLDKQQQIQELEQELALTNRELCYALTRRERETTEPEQIGREEQNKIGYERIMHVDESESDKIAAKTDTPLRISAQQARENSKEAIARTQQLKERYNKLGVQFVSSQANSRKLREQRDKRTTQVQQPEDEQLIFERVKQYSIAYQESLEQLQAQYLVTQGLSKQTKLCLKQIKVELAKMNEQQKNTAKAHFCLAEMCFQNLT